MIVMKFGGASTHTSAGIKNIIGIIRSQLAENPLVVISAIGKTTRNIEQCANEAVAGNADSAYLRLDELIAFHLHLLSESLPKVSQRQVEQRIKELGESLRALLHGLSIVRELSARTLDACRSHGEKFASAIITEALTADGAPLQYIPAEKLIVTDNKYGRASVKEELVRKNVKKHVVPALEKGNVVLTEGYIGAAEDGTPTTMGKESSDYTASLLGALCGASDIQIWTDVNGMMTADPRIVQEAKTIEELSYDEAEELAALGAKILHPLTIVPARINNIPLHIRNSADLKNAGTVIHAVAHTTIPPKVEAVALIASLDLLSKEQTNGQNEFLLRTPGGFARFASTDVADSPAALCAVSIVGEGIGNDTSLLLRMIAALRQMDIRAVLYGASKNSVSVVLGASHGEQALRGIHTEFLS
jgi:aspartate kinase